MPFLKADSKKLRFLALDYDTVFSKEFGSNEKITFNIKKVSDLNLNSTFSHRSLTDKFLRGRIDFINRNFEARLNRFYVPKTANRTELHEN